MTFFSVRKAIEINELIGIKYGAPYGVLDQAALGFALKKGPLKMMKLIIKNNPFVDGNKRTALALYVMAKEDKILSEVWDDLHEIFLALKEEKKI